MKPDANDIVYYCGLILLGIGLAFEVSWPVALIAIGAIMSAVSVVNSYVRIWMSK